uniref:Uncharacterized protein n=2 Tax=Fagus sylvatica TaxID=28930 RepID=A0A2N9EPE5_FAGSY
MEERWTLDPVLRCALLVNPWVLITDASNIGYKASWTTLFLIMRGEELEDIWSDKYIKEKLRSGTLMVILGMSHLEEEDLEIANPSLDEPEMEIRLVEIDGEDNGEEDDVM